MATSGTDQLSQIETTCGSLLYELQLIWDEVGESDDERDKLILELEQECMEVYRRKVDQANHSRAYLRQAIADAEAELASVCSAMSERPVHLRRQTNQNATSLKKELNIATLQLEEMRKRKSDRLSQFLHVMNQIRKISAEIQPDGQDQNTVNIDESDLSIRKLEEFQRHLEELKKEKADRLNQVLEHISTLTTFCTVLGIDFKQTLMEVHPSLGDAEGSKVVSNEVIERLASVINGLRKVKLQRMQKLQDLATTMLELWNLMDTPIEEQQIFLNVTRNIAASEHEITEANTLSADFLNYIEAEVERLEELKVSKMKDLLLKKKSELEELRHKTHLIENGDNEAEISKEAIEDGAMDPSLLLQRIEDQISCVKEDAFSRKEILERVEKWMSACEEEAWLEEYNRDENRYSAGKGAHLILKRAEKARATAQRIPGIVEALCSKVIAWEKERGTEFTYDGVRLLSMLEDYSYVRREKEQERRRQRDQKKLQSQIIAEQESLFGSKPSPSKTQNTIKVNRTFTGVANRKLSLGTAALLPTKPDFPCNKETPSTKRGNEFMLASTAEKGAADIGIQAKTLSFNSGNTNVLQPEPPRKPFSVMNRSNEHEEPPREQVSLLAQILPMTPAQLMPTSTPKTPGTVSKPMQMAATPAPIDGVHEVSATIPKEPHETEYSFEERRLAFVYQL
ncbi:65-kDa microtubule-associated protein 3 [Platanthera guangdongensis]|uniref:65-kDa microtubule-associated protein 3 n=1 Tax=Platanthera guangdongensis TaxID=2320717 RepID=A0ABR2LE29_9ASPA